MRVLTLSAVKILVHSTSCRALVIQVLLLGASQGLAIKFSHRVPCRAPRGGSKVQAVHALKDLLLQSSRTGVLHKSSCVWRRSWTSSFTGSHTGLSSRVPLLLWEILHRNVCLVFWGFCLGPFVDYCWLLSITSNTSQYTRYTTSWFLESQAGCWEIPAPATRCGKKLLIPLEDHLSGGAEVDQGHSSWRQKEDGRISFHQVIRLACDVHNVCDRNNQPGARSGGYAIYIIWYKFTISYISNCL